MPTLEKHLSYAPTSALLATCHTLKQGFLPPVAASRTISNSPVASPYALQCLGSPISLGAGKGSVGCMGSARLLNQDEQQGDTLFDSPARRAKDTGLARRRNKRNIRNIEEPMGCKAPPAAQTSFMHLRLKHTASTHSAIEIICPYDLPSGK